MKTNKGQALLEFILILPVILLLFMGIIDFGRILYEKNRLEGIINVAVDLYFLDKTNKEINNYLHSNYSKSITMEIKKDMEFKSVILSTKINVFTPGLNLVFSNPFLIESKRVIYNE